MLCCVINTANSAYAETEQNWESIQIEKILKDSAIHTPIKVNSDTEKDKSTADMKKILQDAF